MQIANKGIDHHQIVDNLIQYHPEIFIKMINVDNLLYQVQQTYLDTPYGSSSRIKAIKKYKELTNSSLLEAKLTVDTWIVEGKLNG